MKLSQIKVLDLVAKVKRLQVAQVKTADALAETFTAYSQAQDEDVKASTAWSNAYLELQFLIDEGDQEDLTS